MGIQGPYKVGFAETFPPGAGLLNGVQPMWEYDRGTPVEKRRQERDKVSGLPLWQMDGRVRICRRLVRAAPHASRVGPASWPVR
jgi:hypothetical protein